jgi:hypothetical protein
MLINKIHLGQVALAQSFASTFTAQQNLPARLPRRPIRRGPPAGGGQLVRFLARLRFRSLIDRGNLVIHVNTKVRYHARHLRPAVTTLVRSSPSASRGWTLGSLPRALPSRPDRERIDRWPRP